MDSSNNVYLVTNFAQRMYLICFAAFATAPITPIYYMMFGSTSIPIIGNSMLLVGSTMFVGANANSEMLFLSLSASSTS